MRQHFSRTPLVYVGTEPCRAAFMVYCAQGLYVADNRGRIRKNSPTPGLHNIESSDIFRPWGAGPGEIGCRSERPPAAVRHRQFSLYAYGKIRGKTSQNLDGLPLEGKVSHEVGRMRWRAPFLCFSVRGSAFCPPHQPPCVPPVRRTGPSPQGEAFGDASFYDVPDFMEQQRSGEMRKHFSRTPLVCVGTKPCRAAPMVY